MCTCVYVRTAFVFVCMCRKDQINVETISEENQTRARTHKKEKKTACVFCTAISTTVQTVGCFTKRKTTSAVSERESRKEKTLRLGREVIA